MKCRQAKKLLSPYIDDELSAAERTALEEHLESCVACRLELGELEKISLGLKEIYQQVEVPPGLVDSVMLRLRKLEEDQSSLPLGYNLVVRLGRWRRAAVAAAVAAAVGLGALQYGPAAKAYLWGAVASAPAPPDTAVIAQNDKPAPAGEKVAGGENEGAARTPGSGNTVEAAPGSDRAGAQEKQAGDQTGRAGTAGAAAEKKSQSTAPDQEPQQQPPTDTRVASGEAAVAQPKVFLSKTRHVRTTMIKVEVDDLTAAKVGVAAAAAKSGATGLTELWVYQDKEIMLKVVLPSATCEEFLDIVAASGKLLERKQEIWDITTEFNNKVMDYQVFVAKKDEESQAVARALERHLEELDGETLEVGKEVVNVWLKLH